MQALRLATRDVHAQLDSRLPLAHEGAGLPEYLVHLHALHRWLQFLSPVLQRVGWGGEYASAVRSDLDEAGELSVSTPSTDWEASVPDDGAAFAWGVAYVVEGSQLGGQVLCRRLRQDEVPHSLGYLAGRGPETGAHWSRFLAALRTAVTTPQQIAGASRGAEWAFAGILAGYRLTGATQ